MSFHSKYLLSDSIDIESKLKVLHLAILDHTLIDISEINTFYNNLNYVNIDSYKIHDLIICGIMLYQNKLHEHANLKSPFRDIYNVCLKPNNKTFNNLIKNKSFSNSELSFKIGVLSVLNTIPSFQILINKDINTQFKELGYTSEELCFYTEYYDGPAIFKNFALSKIDIEIKNDIDVLF